MASNAPDLLPELAALQTELRKIFAAGGGAPSTSSAGDRIRTDLPTRPVGRARPGIVLGCRLFHWNPDLENVLVDVVHEGQPARFKVYGPFNRRCGSRPHVFFEKVYKTKYATPGQARPGPTPEREFGITYADVRPKSEIKPLMDAFKRCVGEAGALVAAARERLAPVLPAETLAAKQDLHRWIFTVFDIAWRKPDGSPLAATRYIPVEGFDAGMGTNESILYDLDYIRSTPWPELDRRMDRNRWGTFAHLKEPYAAWGVELPEYYASRIDDIVRASDWAIDWLVKQLEGR